MKTKKSKTILGVIIIVLLSGIYLYLKTPPSVIKIDNPVYQVNQTANIVQGKRPRNIYTEEELQEDYFSQDLYDISFMGEDEKVVRQYYKEFLLEERSFFQKMKKRDDVFTFSSEKKLYQLYKRKKFKHKHSFDFVGLNVEGYHLYYKDDKYGMINSKGEIIIPNIYDNLDVLSEGLISAKKGDKWGYINIKNEEVVPFIFDHATLFYEGYASVVYNQHKGVINKKGELVSRKGTDDDWLQINMPLSTYNFALNRFTTRGAYYSWDLRNKLTEDLILCYFKEVKKPEKISDHNPSIHRNYILVFGQYVFDYKGRLVNYFHSPLGDEVETSGEFKFHKNSFWDIKYSSWQGMAHILNYKQPEVLNDSIITVERNSRKYLYNFKSKQKIINSINHVGATNVFFYKDMKEITDNDDSDKAMSLEESIEIALFLRKRPISEYEFDIYDYSGKMLTKANGFHWMQDDEYKINYNDKYGLINDRFYIAPVFDKIVLAHNYYLVKHFFHWALYDKNFEPVTDFIYDSYEKTDDDIKLFSGDKFHYLRAHDTFNDQFFTYADNTSWFSWNDEPTDSLLIIYENKRFGFEDSNGKLKVVPQFEYLNELDNGFYIVRFNEKYGVLNAQGRYVIDPVYDDIEQAGASYFILKNEHNYSLIDSNYEEIEEFSNVELEYTYGDIVLFKNVKGQAPQKIYFNLKSFETTVLNADVLNDGDTYYVNGIFDQDGKYKYTAHFSEEDTLTESLKRQNIKNYTITDQNKSSMYINTSQYLQWGKYGDIDFRGVSDNGRLSFRVDNNYRRITIKNKEQEEVYIDGTKIIGNPQKGLFTCEAENGKIGLYNFFDEKWILPCEYNFIENYEGSHAFIIHKNNKFQICKLNGEIIPFEITPQRIRGSISLEDDGYIICNGVPDTLFNYISGKAIKKPKEVRYSRLLTVNDEHILKSGADFYFIEKDDSIFFDKENPDLYVGQVTDQLIFYYYFDKSDIKGLIGPDLEVLHSNIYHKLSYYNEDTFYGLTFQEMDINENATLYELKTDGSKRKIELSDTRYNYFKYIAELNKFRYFRF
ncbi:WG repeat-containing protein [Flammeovirga aprica]|uniref:WG repeat-containing protein n=1 Tax=Flammeovirga aprica JL-4 TaxID=694437 RepID=A0A7X9RUG7_9BACT|nr:WG repeat-containing protein [Flammeovirga aprica]NME68925.1 WG repeat-containing protein [Flammeovirga aprica JL-4]